MSSGILNMPGMHSQVQIHGKKSFEISVFTVIFNDKTETKLTTVDKNSSYQCKTKITKQYLCRFSLSLRVFSHYKVCFFR